RSALLDAVRGLAGHLPGFKNAQTFQQSAPQMFPVIEPIARMLAPPADQPSIRERDNKVAQVTLARDLMIKVARIDPQVLDQLQAAIRAGNDGYANGIVEKINAALAARLNFPRFWVQDRDFSLIVSPRDYDLVFTIRDKT